MGPPRRKAEQEARKQVVVRGTDVPAATCAEGDAWRACARYDLFFLLLPSRRTTAILPLPVRFTSASRVVING